MGLRALALWSSAAAWGGCALRIQDDSGGRGSTLSIQHENTDSRYDSNDTSSGLPRRHVQIGNGSISAAPIQHKREGSHSAVHIPPQKPPAPFNQTKFFEGSRIKIARERKERFWVQQRRRWDELVHEVGHNLGFERQCDGMIDWLGLIGPIIVPRLKLAFCHVPKAACSDFKDLINMLNGLNTSVGFGRGYTASRPKELKYNWDHVTKESGWKFATFTRDPLERYVSVYGSSCVQQPQGYFEHYPECCGDLLKRNTSVATLVDSFERRAISDAANGLPKEDQHWAPQVQLLFNCGWDRFAPDKLDFIGSISKGHVHDQVASMLRMVNATQTDLEWVKTFFPEGRISGHRNPIKEDHSLFYAKPQVLDAVKGLYEADYALIPHIGEHFTDGLYASKAARPSASPAQRAG
eukprot:CAMPEP_0171181066 /NCGR_PEP_ID=MMETSP0790-20130122/14073_1 /TAXON_ID=2925 /ORGANISM="Alexandrium catenella, Strain OF101" /LENGTH=408 /DNA_ID=CAMNT_0011646003 /DNA_START=1 /DNA_END=1227 /DNA_ORIENTATION=-